MDPIASPDMCLGYGALIAVVVSLLKRVPFISRNPKTIAALLAIFSVAIPAFVRGGADFKVIAFCVIAELGIAIGTYEVAIKPMAAEEERRRNL